MYFHISLHNNRNHNYTVYIIHYPCYCVYSLLFFYLDIPDPVITITPTGSGKVNDNYTLMCSVDIVDDILNIQLNITFLRITNESYEVLKYIKCSGDAVITVDFTPLKTSNSGRYSCSVDMRQATVDYQDVFNESFTINTTSK